MKFEGVQNMFVRIWREKY